jgi:hypothetical protein
MLCSRQALDARTFASAANRFSVVVSEQLDQAARGGPALETCYTCFGLLAELGPFLGPLEPTLRRVKEMLMRCTLSEQYAQVHSLA